MNTPRDAILPIPFRIEIQDGYLVSDQTAPKWVAPKPIMLEHLLVIGTAAEARAKHQPRATTVEMIDHAEILGFARRWGTLGICKQHERPGCRESNCLPEQLPSNDGMVWREPLWIWCGIIERAMLMRRVGESIQSGGSGSETDWKGLIIEDRSAEPRSNLLRRIWAETGTDYLGQPWKSKRSARKRFSSIMNQWLYLGNTQPHFAWESDRWGIRSSVPGGLWPAFGYLSLYLALAVAGGRESAFCYFCAREYFPERRPSPGQRNCCGDEGCKRIYWREYRKKTRLAAREGNDHEQKTWPE